MLRRRRAVGSPRPVVPDHLALNADRRRVTPPAVVGSRAGALGRSRGPRVRRGVYATLIGMVAAFASGPFGTVMVSTPLWKTAFTLAPSTGEGRRMLREKAP